jgi:hypothetical protein
MRSTEILFAAAMSTLVLGGCTTGAEPAVEGDDEGDLGEDLGDSPPFVFPEATFSGNDGVNVYKVPVTTNLSGDVTWTIADPSIASIAPVAAPSEFTDIPGAWALITTKAAGTTSFTAIGDEGEAEGTINVAAYDAADVRVGATRYTAASADAGRTPCASCHAGPEGTDHSPLELAIFPDDEALSIVKQGTYPDDVSLTVEHTWSLTAAEDAGIIPYLRQLPPRGF